MTKPDTSAAAKLKSCPFCGCKASLKKGPTVYSIECAKGSSCIGSGLLIGFMHDAFDHAVSQWNARADTTLSEALDGLLIALSTGKGIAEATDTAKAAMRRATQGESQ